MGTSKGVLHVLFLLSVIGLSVSYRLNVPRVLLPFHPKIPVNFMLEVKGGCFSWRSTRPDIVAVEPVEPDASGCSERAIITSKSKYDEEQNAVVFAENFEKSVSLSCGVTIDVIDRITITTTTKILFVDGAPAQMIVEAYNREGDKFSTLGGIPFDWYFNAFNADNPRALRIVPFAQSKYDAPNEIMTLEKERHRGYVVLVEGTLTGSATLSAKFDEPIFSKVEATSIDLMVIANVLLVPSHNLYLPMHSIVQYRAQLIKQKGIEDVKLPSEQYSLALSDSSVCQLDVHSSKVTAVSLGRTEVTLIDSHIKGKFGIKPQSAHIYVVEPDTLSFSVDRGNNWYFQKGLDYKINVQLSDSAGNHMYIPDNALFHTSVSEEYFEIIEKSRNGTYFHVIARKTGVTSLHSSLISMQDQYGVEHPFPMTIAADQEVHINDKLEAKPYILVFPYHPSKPYTYQLHATGGSGNYAWQSSNPRVGAVDEQKGKLVTAELGESIIRVEDVYNPQHFALVHVYVLKPASLHWGESHVEAEVDNHLTLNILMHGLNTKTQKHMPFTDCRHINFNIAVEDVSIFRHKRDANSEIPIEGRGCSTVSLKALSSGDTKVKVQYEDLSASVDISAYSPLVLSTKDHLLLASGSVMNLDLQGGPRPWMHDSSKYFTAVSSEDKKVISISGDLMSYKLKCSKQIGDVDILVSVGNRKSATNPLPMVSTAKVTVCCAIPERISLNTRHHDAKPGLPACPAFVHSVYYGYPTALHLTAYGRCVKDVDERMFDSLTSAKAQYEVDHPSLLSVKPDNKKFPTESNKLIATANPSGKAGTVTIAATATIMDHKLPTSLTLNLVGTAKAQPSSVVLWNAPDARRNVQIHGGSGHFWMDSDAVSQYITPQILHTQDGDSSIEIRPVALTQSFTTLSVYDLCIEGAQLDIKVKVTDVNKVRISGPELIQMNSIAPLRIDVLDIDDQPFSSQDVKIMDLDVVAQGNIAHLTPISLFEYQARGMSVGTSSIVATVKSSSGNVVQSLPYMLQVFSPLKLQPEVVTLIPESVFQFEVTGGPHPIPKLQFNMSKSDIIEINSVGLIKSLKTLGETTVTAVVSNGKSDDIITQDTAIVRVVSLAGIRIVLSSRTVEEGDVVSAHIEGLQKDETPFAFGGAEYPLDVKWKISTPEILTFDSLLTEGVKQQTSNQFGARFIAVKNGKVTVEAVVTLHPQSSKHFSSRKKEYSDSVQVIVQESLRLSSPRRSSESLLITPSTTIDLTANRPSQQIIYKTLQTKVISVIGENQNILLSGPNKGTAPLRLHHHGSAFNETTFITVDVATPSSLHLMLEIPTSVSSTTVSTLPRGIKARLRVQFRDHRGRLFDATNNNLKFRPHRFDLTDIVALDNNRTFDIFLKEAGETVFRVWDASNPRLSTYIRMPVAEVIVPQIVDSKADKEKDENCEAKSSIARITNDGPLMKLRPSEKDLRYQGFVGWINQIGDIIWPFLTTIFLIFAAIILLYLGYLHGIQKPGDTDGPWSQRSASMNYSGLRRMNGSSSESKSVLNNSGVAAKYRGQSSYQNMSGRLFDDDSLNNSRQSAGSGNESYLFGSTDLRNRYYDQ